MSEEFLKQEREEMGDWEFQSEYNCTFQDEVDQLYRTEDIQAALTSEVGPLFGTDEDEHLTDTDLLFPADG